MNLSLLVISGARLIYELEKEFTLRSIIYGFIISCLVGTHVSAQVYDVRLYTGGNYYQGDLSPGTSIYSFSHGQFALGASGGIQITSLIRVNLKFIAGKLAADDANANNPQKRKRNLSFVSPLHELGIGTDINLNYIFPFLNKSGLRLYVSTGINVFHFDPYTFARDEFGFLEPVRLQPLSTEGQGLPGRPDVYALTQVNIPIAMGFRFHLFKQYEFGIEFGPRLTFTDYLDDVSTTYVDRTVLSDNFGPLSAQMSNRTAEYLGLEIDDYSAGQPRGNPSNNDWYFFTGVYMSYNFGSDYKPLKFKTITDIEDGDVQEVDE